MGCKDELKDIRAEMIKPSMYKIAENAATPSEPESFKSTEFAKIKKSEPDMLLKNSELPLYKMFPSLDSVSFGGQNFSTKFSLKKGKRLKIVPVLSPKQRASAAPKRLNSSRATKRYIRQTLLTTVIMPTNIL